MGHPFFPHHCWGCRLQKVGERVGVLLAKLIPYGLGYATASHLWILPIFASITAGGFLFEEQLYAWAEKKKLEQQHHHDEE